MAAVAVSTQLQQWAFEKPSTVRPERSDSSASSPDLYHNHSETLRIRAATVDTDAQALDSKETLSFQERYLSSEEDLSPVEGNSDSDFDADDNDEDNDNDNASIHEPEKELCRARKMSISRFEKGKSCDMAVIVSFVSAGRPKMINLETLGSPFREPTQPSQRSASLAQLPTTAIHKLRDVERTSRHSLAVCPASPSPSRSASPAISVQSRRTSPGPAASSRNSSSLHSSDSSLIESSTRSSSPWANARLPTSAAAAAAANQPTRSSLLYVTATIPTKSQSIPTAPPTPVSPVPPAFLSSDPYETSTVSSASPIIKSSPHKRLRSISQKLSLAKIAITPSTKKWDSRINGKSANSPPMPLTPHTPVTPQTAPPTSFSASRLRRNSRASRPISRIGTPETPPPVPSMLESQSSKRLQRLIPRGANEREPMIELPPFPSKDADSDPTMSLMARRIRKRRSLMDLL